MERLTPLKVLLDTHIWIWRLLDPGRLPRQLAEKLSQPEIRPMLSPITVWETLILARKGRLSLEPTPEAWVRDALRLSRPTMIPLTHDIAIRSEALQDFGTADPADRFLVATALVHDLPIATADGAILAFGPVTKL